jgi:carboxylesterase
MEQLPTIDEVKELAKGYFWPGTNGAVVLICHGFGGSPAEHYLTAKALNEAGYAVRVPLLPGHATKIQDLDKTKWTEWYQTLVNEYEELCRQYKKIFFCGLSMGGLMVLRLAEHVNPVAISVMAPALFNKDKSSSFAWLMLPFKKHLSMARWGEAKYPGGTEILLKGGYNVISVHSIVELNHAEANTRRHLKDIKAPLICFQSQADMIVDPKEAPYLMKHVSSVERSVVWFKDSSHVMSMDKDHDEIFQKTIAFFNAHL